VYQLTIKKQETDTWPNI